MATKTKSTMKRPAGHVPGGGAFSSKRKEVPLRTGGENRAMSPRAVNQLGNHVGNPQAVAMLDAGKALSPPLGNELAAKTKCGPGGSRQVLSHGTQK